MDDAERVSIEALEHIRDEIKDSNKARKTNGGSATHLPPPQLPMAVARLFVAERCTYEDTLTLRHWHGGWWSWRSSRWRELEDRAVRSLLYEFTEDARYVVDGRSMPWAPTRRKIGDLLEALAAICLLPDEFEQPCWLDGRTNGCVGCFIGWRCGA
jgi:putative DNA primase/helicase